MTNDIPFTQYLRPNGRRVATVIERSPEMARLAHTFIAAGGWFESEELNTGQASLTACFFIDGEPQDIASEIVRNGPAVPKAVDRLIQKAVLFLVTIKAEKRFQM